MDIVEVRNLYKYYGKARGILDVSFSIPEGEIFGFIGPNGAGKSTTIRILLSLIHASSGEASLFGMDCLKDGRKIRQNVGYLPAEVNFYDDMRVSAFLEYAAKFHPGDKECRSRSRKLCEALDLDTGKRVGALSSGNKKKLAIVQAMMHRPSLLILDEPTSGLDPLIQNTLYDLLREENARGTTLFFSSHVLSEVQKMCDRVAIIKEGRILQVETVDRLRGSQYKEIRIEFHDENGAAAFELEDAAGVSRHGKQVDFLYKGDIGDIIRRLAAQEIDNLWMDEPDLDDVFLHFYKKSDEGGND